MGQILSYGGLNDLPFGVIDGDIVDLVNNFKTDECTERIVDWVPLAGLYSDFSFFDTM